MDEREAQRAAFEKWYEAERMPLEGDWFKRDKDFPEMYDSNGVDASWDGWQAALDSHAAAIRVRALEEAASVVENRGIGSIKAFDSTGGTYINLAHRQTVASAIRALAAGEKEGK